MKKILSVLLAICLLLSLEISVFAKNSNELFDVPETEDTEELIATAKQWERDGYYLSAARVLEKVAGIEEAYALEHCQKAVKLCETAIQCASYSDTGYVNEANRVLAECSEKIAVFHEKEAHWGSAAENYDDAGDAFEKIAEHDRAFSAFKKAAENYEKAEEPKKQQVALEKAASVGPRTTEMGWILLQLAEMEDADFIERKIGYYEDGASLLESEEPLKAAEAYQKAGELREQTAQDENDDRYIDDYKRGVYAAFGGNCLEKAKELLILLSEKDPRGKELYYPMGMLYFAQADAFSEAGFFAEEMGDFYREQKNVSRAVEFYERAVQYYRDAKEEANAVQVEEKLGALSAGGSVFSGGNIWLVLVGVAVIAVACIVFYKRKK